ncbi:MAG: ABC transporter permease, partial [Blastocatellia bacterium]
MRFGIQMSPTFTYYDHPYSYFRILHDRGGVFSDVFSAWPTEMSFASGDHVRNVEGETVSGNYFSTLGLKPELGRLFTNADEQTNGQVAVISSDFWRRQFASRRDIMGQTIRLRGSSFNIIGVLAPGFSGIDLENQTDVWVPMSKHSLCKVYMRMRPGVRIPQAEAEVLALYPVMLSSLYQGRKSAEDVQEEARARPAVVTSIERGVSAMRKQFAAAVTALLGGVSVFLVLVCANVGGLILQRNHARRRYAAIRIALGASRWRLTQRMLAEAFLISCVGTGIGSCLAYMCGPLLLDLLPGTRPLGIVLKPDALVISFAAALCILAAGLTSVTEIPNLVRTDPGIVMRRESGNPRYHFGRALGVLQIAVALVLLTGSFVLAKSLSKLHAEDPGFIPDKLILAKINPLDMGASRPDLPGIFEQILQKARLLPGVRSVSLAEEAPMQGVGLKITVLPTGSRIGTADSLNISMNVVSLNHLENIGVRLLEGREFEASDENEKPQPAIITANLAHEFFPGIDPIGQTFGSPNNNG